LTKSGGGLALRTSEWVLIYFFGYVAALAPFFRDRPVLKYQPAFVLAGVFTLLWAMARTEQTRFAEVAGMVRDWLPLVLTLGAFREMELFLPVRFDHLFEAEWVRWDHLLLGEWHLRSMIESFGGLLPLCLELCYLLVYGTGFFCVALLYVQHRRVEIDRFLAVYLIGTLLAYALFPYFPSEPPRIVFPGLDGPLVATWARTLNLWILKIGTIHVGVFPSAHVSSAFSAAWGMFLVLPYRKFIGCALLLYALAVSIATVYGRYHYAADVLAGFAVSLIPGFVCLILSERQRRVQKTSNFSNL
jgi:membrane-associated phospholipid phosphatase